jgi:methylmalonyl-CoA/ethylmalonyl-CoA epimerase
MAKIKHIALSVKDPDAAAKFFVEVFEMNVVGKFDGHGAKGYYLSDGNFNLALLDFKSDVVAGAGRDKDWLGIHHFGFQVDSLEAIHEKLTAAGSQPLDAVNEFLGVGPGARQESNVEVKYAGPDGMMIDVSETGWDGASRS